MSGMLRQILPKHNKMMRKKSRHKIVVSKTDKISLTRTSQCVPTFKLIVHVVRRNIQNQLKYAQSRTLSFFNKLFKGKRFHSSFLKIKTKTCFLYQHVLIFTLSVAGALIVIACKKLHQIINTGRYS